MENKTKIAKDTMTMLPIGAIFPVKCDTTSELDAAYQNACHIRRKYPRDDGAVYKIQRSGKTMTVTVSVVRKEATV